MSYGSSEQQIPAAEIPFLSAGIVGGAVDRGARERRCSKADGLHIGYTQAAEQRVDIDADLLITDLAPTNMLLQRLGRLSRHTRTNRPQPAPEVSITLPRL